MNVLITTKYSFRQLKLIDPISRKKYNVKEINVGCLCDNP